MLEGVERGEKRTIKFGAGFESFCTGSLVKKLEAQDYDYF